MSLLAPLYVAGVLAVSLPILFHLIRRTPRGRTDFSSLMFLAPSPPRITRRSRLNNIVLLLLRAAALSLLAFAFARPFLRRDVAADAGGAKGRRIAVMLDTSASMRRGDLWPQALRRAEQVVADLKPADEAALFFFDRTVRPAMTFAEWNELDHPRRLAALRARLAEASPTWESTRLGDALAAVGEVVGEGDTSRDKPIAGASRQLVCITDMQEGAHIDALQAHPWPPSVLLDVKPVTLTRSSNAGLHLATDTDAAEADPSRLRVRVANAPDSARDQFSLAWASDRGPVAGIDPVKVYVPAGHGQTVRVPWPAPDQRADRLVLTGDDADFDNTLYVVPPRKEQTRVVYLGDDAPDDTRGLRYYLDSALVETPRRKVEIIARKSAEPLTDADLAGVRLVVVTWPRPMTEDESRPLRRFAWAGGDVLRVITDATAADGVWGLTETDDRMQEAKDKDFALLARIDTSHPLFAPFGDARFADFSRIHFWHHRRFKPSARSEARILAAFDDGDPFLLEQPIGKGRVYVLTSGWQPADSQLALSTKFVPLIAGMLRRDDASEVQTQYVVHDPVALPPQPAGATKPTLRAPDGHPIELAANSRTFDGADQPGIYRLTLTDREVPIAVNLSPDESRTAPVGVEELEQWGAKLGTNPTHEELATRQRQLQVLELENRQKLWRWFIVAVIGLLFAETALAGGLARRALRPEQENA